LASALRAAEEKNLVTIHLKCEKMRHKM
jgi:hypothetical protein